MVTLTSAQEAADCNHEVMVLSPHEEPCLVATIDRALLICIS